MMKRSEPGTRSDWSGWGTIDGLNSAAASKEYSWEKQAPMSNSCASESCRSVGSHRRACSNRRFRKSRDLVMAVVEIRHYFRQE